MTETDAERFWDERAKENALYFVDTSLNYASPDTADFWGHGEEVLDRMLQSTDVSIAPENELLDIGCGVGRMTRALAHRAAHIYGLDISREMLERAEALNDELHNVTWLHGDGRGLAALDDDSVDGCFSHVVFQHVPDPEITLAYVRDMGRVLRPSGWALFQLSTDPTVHEPPKQAGRGLRARLRVRRQPSQAAWWGSSVEVPALRAAADQGSLVIERVIDEGTQYTTVLARRRD
jgi:SAM-dependent methyltransferase